MMAGAVSTDEGNNFTSVRFLDGNPDFDGKMTNANVTFSGKNALVFYSKVYLSEVPPGGSTNHYSWIQQIIPIQWFYEGDKDTIYGEKFLS